MLSFSRRRIATITAAVVALGVALPAVAQAEPPSNDDFAASTAVTALPFTTQLDTSEATEATDDPFWCQGYDVGGTVWFSYTPTEDALLRATTDGSGHGTILSANTGTRGELAGVPNACDIGTTTGATITFPARAGTTYHFMVAGYRVPGGALSFGLRTIPPTPNDAFADAEALTLPSTRETDLSAATTEYDEPDQGCGVSVARSTWYAFTPTETKSVLARLSETYSAAVAVYTGDTLLDLTRIGCAGSGYSPVLFRATAGTTYYLQVFGSTHTDTATLNLTEAPPLRPYFTTSPYEPTIYELTQFQADTGEFNTPVAGGEWDFGDGTVTPANGASISHHYTADGTYQVTLTVVSPDGRTATRTSPVTVETHDVSISRFATPAKARTGDTKQITVQVANTRYLESVTTDLYKSEGAGWVQVGTLTLDVPASPTRTVRFPFAYTFTAADAVAGKVAFKAVVRLPYDVRDARPFDNELISTAATVLPSLTALKYA